MGRLFQLGWALLIRTVVYVIPGAFELLGRRLPALYLLFLLQPSCSSFDGTSIARSR